MNYTEEEKKAIEDLNKLIIDANTEDADMNDCFGGEHIEGIETLLKLIEKQQALIENYKIAFYNEKDIVKEQQKEITRLENIKNICPITNTSGIRCDLEEAETTIAGVDYSLA